MICMKKTLLYIATLVWLGCGTTTEPSTTAVEMPLEEVVDEVVQTPEELEPSNMVEVIVHDLNKDGEDDRIELTNPPEQGDPGQFSTITIQLNGKEDPLELTYEDMWDGVDPKILETWPNHISSNRIFFQRYSNENYLILYGFQYGCCVRQLTVIKVFGDFCAVVFNEPFELEHFTDLDGDDIMEIVGRNAFIAPYEVEMKEATITATDYVPYRVYTLTDMGGELDEVLTEKYNTENYLFAGFDNRIGTMKVAQGEEGWYIVEESE